MSIVLPHKLHVGGCAAIIYLVRTSHFYAARVLVILFRGPLLLDVHGIRITLLLLFLHSRLNTFQECLHRVAPTKRDTAVAHESSILDLDLQRLADAGQSTIPQSDSQAGQALMQLRGAKNALKDVFLLCYAESLNGCLHGLGVGLRVGEVGGFLGEEEDRRREIREKRVDESRIARFDDGNGRGGGEKIGQSGEQAALSLRRTTTASTGIERVEKVLDD